MKDIITGREYHLGILLVTHHHNLYCFYFSGIAEIQLTREQLPSPLRVQHFNWQVLLIHRCAGLHLALEKSSNMHPSWARYQSIE